MSRITTRRTGDTIAVQQHVTDRFAWNTLYTLEEARELIRQLEALLRGTSAASRPDRSHRRLR